MFVAPIEKIVIFTKVHQLRLDTYEKIEVQAFDAEDNVFSSLEGLR